MAQDFGYKLPLPFSASDNLPMMAVMFSNASKTAWHFAHDLVDLARWHSRLKDDVFTLQGSQLEG